VFLFFSQRLIYSYRRVVKFCVFVFTITINASRPSSKLYFLSSFLWRARRNIATLYPNSHIQTNWIKFFGTHPGGIICILIDSLFNSAFKHGLCSRCRMIMIWSSTTYVVRSSSTLINYGNKDMVADTSTLQHVLGPFCHSSLARIYIYIKLVEHIYKSTLLFN